MKNYFTLVLVFFSFLTVKASDKDSTIYYNLPDSVKAVQFMAEVSIQSYDARKWFRLRLTTGGPMLEMTNGRKSGLFIFYPTANLGNITRGLNTGFDLKSFGITFSYKWELNETYKLLISQAADSTGNITIYSGYVFLPRENKWKFIGSGKVEKWQSSLSKPALSCFHGKKQKLNFTTGQVWVQRNTGSWKNMKNETLPIPTINLFGHMDSVQQRQIDMKIINDAIGSGKTDVKDNVESIYYKMIKEGTGRQVSINDTVTVFYKGYLFANDSVFDQTKEKSATFPLKRLIRGWQIGVPLCKVGGKIKLVILSDLAYSIRTRAAKIPPNSILVFEIEVLDANPPQ